MIQGPDATSPVQRGLHGDARIAEGAIAGYLDGKNYLKITCMSGERLHGASNLAIRSAAQGTE